MFTGTLAFALALAASRLALTLIRPTLSACLSVALRYTFAVAFAPGFVRWFPRGVVHMLLWLLNRWRFRLFLGFLNVQLLNLLLQFIARGQLLQLQRLELLSIILAFLQLFNIAKLLL